MSAQTTSHLLLVRPASFRFNSLTADTNTFQKDETGNTNIQALALAEFDRFAEVLRSNDLDVTVVDDTADPPRPDAIFPNNWISFIDGKITLYPMQALNRRTERREEVVSRLARQFGIDEIIDLSYFEEINRYLEGTGSIVPDRKNRMAYACLSPRTDEEVLKEFCRIHRYEPVVFRAVDANGNAIYHTNVMMCMGDRFVIICFEAIQDSNDREKLKRSFSKTGKEEILISRQQMEDFAGNMLQVENRKGQKLLVLSARAHASLSTTQVAILEKYSTLLPVPLTTIEQVGGGSARCMTAEIFTR